MVHPIIFILWCLLIIINIILIFLVATSRGQTLEALQYPLVWCYIDWLCGTGSTIDSPVLDTTPILYACRIENFTVDQKMVTSVNPTGQCVCPVKFVEDYVLDNKVGSPTYGKLIQTTTPESSLYVCDNIANNNPATAIDESGSPAGIVGICSPDVCQTLWQKGKPNFSTRTGPGQLTAVDNSMAWKSKTGTRQTPLIYQTSPPTPYTISSDSTMPTYSMSIIANQLKK